jgi:hypothetical protein
MASGGVVSTLADLARWHGYLLGARPGPGSPALPRQLLAPGALASGEPIDYAWGMYLGEHRGRKIVWHAGTGPGFVADMVLFPAERLSVFCLCNGVIDSRALSRSVADLYLDGAAGEPPASGAAATAAPSAPVPTQPSASSPGPRLRLSGEVLSALAGRYRNPQSGAIWEVATAGEGVVVRTGRLRFDFAPVEADALATSEAGWEGWLVRFEPPRDGAVPRLRLFEGSEEKSRYERLPAPLSAERLLAYAGRFASEELGAVYTFAAEEGRLVLHTPVQPNGPLLYVGGEAFVLPTEWFDLYFEFARGQDGADGFTLSTTGVSGIVFRREAACSGPAPPAPSAGSG